MDGSINSREELQLVQKIKITTLIMEWIGVLIFLYETIIGFLFFAKIDDIEKEGIEVLNSGEFSDLYGGFEILGGLTKTLGSVFLELGVLILTITSVALFVQFLIGGISALLLYKKTKHYKPELLAEYCSKVKRDAYTKIIIAVISVVILILAFYSFATVAIYVVCLWYAAICFLEIKVLNLSKRYCLPNKD